jgi:hypothetical protein
LISQRGEERRGRKISQRGSKAVSFSYVQALAAVVVYKLKGERKRKGN